MIVVTSLSSSHSNAANQIAAIESWQSLGPCFSLNSHVEMLDLQLTYHNIRFVPTRKTIEHLVGKKLVAIFAMVDFAIEIGDDGLLIINSDIIVKNLPELKQDGITLFSRYDYDTDMNVSQKFENGFDAFYIPRHFLYLFPFSIYAMGACFHDYVFALMAIEKNIPVYYPKEKYCYHKKHPVHYPLQEYYDIGEYFRLDFKLDKSLTIPQIAAQSLAKIKQNLISY